jgi:ribosomal-protein-alanine N-acetyltransferase
MEDMEVITRTGRALTLRPPAPDDLEEVFRIHADPRANTHNPAGPMPDREAARVRLETWLADWNDHGIGYWVITEPSAEAPHVLGFAGVRVIEARGRELLNLYYRLEPEAWGQGIASALARHAVGQAHERPVLARMQPGHVGSERTALAAGLRHVGRDPWGRIVLADRPLDAATLAALPPPV